MPKVRINVIIDEDTIKELRKYSKEKTGHENISNAIRMMVRECVGAKNDGNKS